MQKYNTIHSHSEISSRDFEVILELPQFQNYTTIVQYVLIPEYNQIITTLNENK